MVRRRGESLRRGVVEVEAPGLLKWELLLERLVCWKRNDCEWCWAAEYNGMRGAGQGGRHSFEFSWPSQIWDGLLPFSLSRLTSSALQEFQKEDSIGEPALARCAATNCSLSC